MKIAVLLNPKLSKWCPIILDNTWFYKNSDKIVKKNLKPLRYFFDFVESNIGNRKIGDIEDCYVVIVDFDKKDEFVSPLKLVGEVMSRYKVEEISKNN